jgi:hypothetical protein
MIGVILGSAFDQAIRLTLRHWKVVIATWVLIGGAYVFDRTANATILNLVAFAWYPVPAVIACAEVGADFTLTGRSVFRLFAVEIIWLAATIGFVATVFALTLSRVVQLNATAAAFLPGSAPYAIIDVVALTTSIWIGTKWSLAPTIVIYEHEAIAASFGRSWRLTTKRFWQTLGFNTASTIAYMLVWFGPMVLAFSAIDALVHPGVTADMRQRYIPAFFVPLLVYGGIAVWLSYIKWLQWLESRP